MRSLVILLKIMRFYYYLDCSVALKLHSVDEPDDSHLRAEAWQERLSRLAITFERCQRRAVIRARINRLELGNFGDCKSVGTGVLELRVSFGPGYRVYFGRDGNTLVVLLCGGDKGSQAKDILKAKLLWKEYKDASKKL